MSPSPITIVGSGVVGTATGKGFADAGFDVTFIDVLPNRINTLNEEGYNATDTIDLSASEDRFIFLTLPTPNVAFSWDLSAFESGVVALGKALKNTKGFHTVIVRSTVPPGTTEDLVQPILERESGKKAGQGFGIASAPEFLRAASAIEDFKHPWMTVIGSRSRRTIERIQELFTPFGGEVRTFDNPASAELVKVTHNVYNAVKISFFNEIWTVAQDLGLDHDAIASTVALSAEAMFNPLYGTKGGAPYGGVCLPKDTKGFLGYAAGRSIELPVLRATVETNTRMEQLVDSELSAATDQVIDLREGSDADVMQA